MFEPTDQQKAIVAAEGHLLVKGGPGSGKTTISIVKAEALVETALRPGQRVLFLSFARATVARVIEALDEQTNGRPEVRRRIDIDTYHAFFWRLFRTHGYLIGLSRRLEILTPTDRAVALTPIRQRFGSTRNMTDDRKREKERDEDTELMRLAVEDGKVCFDLFAEFVTRLLNGSEKVRKLVSTKYPVIILDEFQDTNPGQWSVVQSLGIDSTLIALADEEQRIYDFIGADPERLNQFIALFAPTVYDFGGTNHRSNGTDIARFGNDIVAGRITGTYSGMKLVQYPGNANQAMAAMKGQVLQARKRLTDAKGSDWSLAILVPTKHLMRVASDALRATDAGMPAISHHAAIDMEGAILAAQVIAFLLQPSEGSGDFQQFADLLCNFFRGKGGDDPSTADINEAANIQKALQKAVENARVGKEPPANSIIRPVSTGYEQARSLDLTGNPESDWLAIWKILEACGCKRLAKVVEEARNVRLLDRGTQLRDSLSAAWRADRAYTDALAIVRQAFVQEHFSTSVRRQSGVIVMNMHKAKGKQFDEVIIFEGWPRFANRQIVANLNRIVRGNVDGQDLTHAKYNFRVSVTRARMQTTVMTPDNDPCILLVQAARAAAAEKK